MILDHSFKVGTALKPENNDTDTANQLLLNKGILSFEPLENIETLKGKSEDHVD